MKTIFIPAKLNLNLEEREIANLKVGDNTLIAYSIQHQNLALNFKKILSKKYKNIQVIQVLGCSKPFIKKEIKSIILLSSGRFHAVSLAYETNLPVYILENNKLLQISQNEIDLLKMNKKSAYVQFLSSSQIGMIISTKPGQENLKQALILSKQIEKEYSKKTYHFISNNINVKEFENFGLDSWVNTACPRMDFNTPIINIRDLKEIKKS